ncbi:MAG TPA: TetR/AcrR family transcriptional regulator [Thermoanaerobaculia bacterium]|jgi:AcrR family transcriptional regulator|nr:TetR/AcrR family transcriptional regulator [Thermoanaerobaculia bacterium]
MRKGEATRGAILDHASKLARRVGLGGLSIGRLAEDLNLSKSGLFAHFRSKEALQIQVLETTAAQFVESVVKPALAAPRGEPRLRALFGRWLEWARSQKTPGGCLFVAAAVELDDRPGPVRRKLVQTQRDFLTLMANVFQSGIGAGHFRSEVDPEQFAHDLYAVMLGYHHASRLLKDPAAEARAWAGVEVLLAAAGARRRAPRKKRAAGL